MKANHNKVPFLCFPNLDVKELSYKNLESKSQLPEGELNNLSDVKELSYKNLESKSQPANCFPLSFSRCERTKL